MMATHAWTAEDRAAFVTAWNSGETVASMAKRFNCERTAITFWRKRFGLEARPRNVKRGQYAAKRARTPRTCLGCDKTFMSWGNYNRICPTCRDNVEFTQGADREPAVIRLSERGTL